MGFEGLFRLDRSILIFNNQRIGLILRKLFWKCLSVYDIYIGFGRERIIHKNSYHKNDGEQVTKLRNGEF